MAKLRIALTISGAVSLGAYEAGVLAGLLSGILPLCEGEDPAIRLDAIGGASAGSMAGLLAARCLTAGYDPVYVMEQAWELRTVTGSSCPVLVPSAALGPGTEPLAPRL